MSALPRAAWRGRVAYRRALHEQRVRRERVIAGAPEAFWLLEHPEVVTTGRRAVDLPSDAWLRSRGADLVRTERGGLLTWHGPGQLVGYFIVDIGRMGLGSRKFVHGVEQGLIDWLARVGVPAERRNGLHGVWCGERKIASLGLHIRHGVTLHGFSLNLDPDLRAFEGFVACGVAGAGVTSVRLEGGGQWTPALAARSVSDALEEAIVAICVDS